MTLLTTFTNFAAGRVDDRHLELLHHAQAHIHGLIDYQWVLDLAQPPSGTLKGWNNPFVRAGRDAKSSGVLPHDVADNPLLTVNHRPGIPNSPRVGNSSVYGFCVRPEYGGPIHGVELPVAAAHLTPGMHIVAGGEWSLITSVKPVTSGPHRGLKVFFDDGTASVFDKPQTWVQARFNPFSGTTRPS